ncbi:MAG TPA: peroxiredoxin [Kofleriaceae bacterium]|nr:peroxiredoxin [Kofleriaceae bacterium]
MIEVGQKIPSVKVKRANEEGGEEIDTAAFFAGKKVILFSLPGAFTPTCSQKHLPGYVKELPQLRAKGVDMVACLSVNDSFVMRDWAKQHDALGKVEMIADGNADFSKALGIETDLTKANMGIRCRRGLIILEDGVVKSIEMEAPGKFEVSSAEACSLKLGA